MYHSTADAMTFSTQISMALKFINIPGNCMALYFPAGMPQHHCVSWAELICFKERSSVQPTRPGDSKHFQVQTLLHREIQEARWLSLVDGSFFSLLATEELSWRGWLWGKRRGDIKWGRCCLWHSSETFEWPQWELCLFWREGGASGYPWVHSPWCVVVGWGKLSTLALQNQTKTTKETCFEVLVLNCEHKGDVKKDYLLLQENHAEKFWLQSRLH